MIWTYVTVPLDQSSLFGASPAHTLYTVCDCATVCTQHVKRGARTSNPRSRQSPSCILNEVALMNIHDSRDHISILYKRRPVRRTPNLLDLSRDRRLWPQSCEPKRVPKFYFSLLKFYFNSTSNMVSALLYLYIMLAILCGNMYLSLGFCHIALNIRWLMACSLLLENDVIG